MPIAMAVFRGDDWKLDYEGRPPLRPAVCIGQIVHHDALEDGRHNILLHGVCRAKIVRLIEPTSERPYRMARLEPLEAVEEQPPPMHHVRRALKSMLTGPRVYYAFGRDFATANTEFIPFGSERIGRQSQTWVRTERGWKIVSAHVSFLS